jgi:lipopolysaccharide export system protein LptA
MKIILMLLLAVNGGFAWAQTNAPGTTAPATNAPPAQTVIDSKYWQFDGNTRQGIYLGDVVVTNPKGVLHCGQLIVDLPPDGSHPTNIVAVTNVVIDALDEKGQTNHITADKAVYTYSVVNSVTNETIVFTGGDPMPKVETPQFTGLGDPLTFDLITKKYSASNFKTIFKQPPGLGNGTNASPFNFLK